MWILWLSGQTSRMVWLFWWGLKNQEKDNTYVTSLYDYKVSYLDNNMLSTHCPHISQSSPPMVVSWNSSNCPLTKRSTRLDLPTAMSPSSTNLNWQILVCGSVPLERPPLPLELIPARVGDGRGAGRPPWSGATCTAFQIECSQVSLLVSSPIFAPCFVWMKKWEVWGEGGGGWCKITSWLTSCTPFFLKTKRALSRAIH